MLKRIPLSFSEAEIHKALKPLLSKRDQGRVMGALRELIPMHNPRSPEPAPYLEAEAVYDGYSHEPDLGWTGDNYQPAPGDVVLYKIVGTPIAVTPGADDDRI